MYLLLPCYSSYYNLYSSTSKVLLIRIVMHTWMSYRKAFGRHAESMYPMQLFGEHSREVNIVWKRCEDTHNITEVLNIDLNYAAHESCYWMECSQASCFCDKNWMELHSWSAGICWWKLLWSPNIIQRACMGHSRQMSSLKCILCTRTTVRHYCSWQALHLPLYNI